MGGQILSRQDYASVAQTGSLYNLVLAGGATPTTRPVEFYYYANGVRIGDVGNDGPSTFNYANAIANRGLAAQTTVFKSGTSGQDAADFDQSFDPVNPTTDAATGGSYVVHAGDTLQSIASQIWGDASLWYMLAEANGLSGSEALATGVVLTLPNKILNAKNTSDTFKVYDPTEAMGPVTDYRSPKKKKHGLLGIFIALVAMAVTFLVAPYATAGAINVLGAMFGGGAATVVGGTLAIAAGNAITAAGYIVGGALAAAAGSVASQAIGIATGYQDQFSWKAVGLAALSGAVSAGVSGAGSLTGADGFGANGFVPGLRNVGGVLGDVERGMASSIISQGLGVATGLQNKFSWSQVAATGIQTFAGHAFGQSALGQSLANALPFGANTNAGLVSGMAGMIAGAGSKSLMDGTDFGQNMLDLLPGLIASTVGAVRADAIDEDDGATFDDEEFAEHQSPRTLLRQTLHRQIARYR